jgi:Zn-dependent peptidase ImmA (M78 family)
MPRSARALINKETLAYICSQIGVSAAFLAKELNVAENTIQQWLTPANALLPTFNQAKNLAKILKIPFAGLYMAKEFVPVNQIPKVRNFRTMPAGKLTDDSKINIAIADLIRSYDFLISSMEELNLQAPLLALPAIDTDATSFQYAEIIRSYFKIDINVQIKLQTARQFFLYIRMLIENKGIFINGFKGIDIETIRGISIFDETAPIIGINNKDQYPAKTFTIIHELVHILKKQSVLCNDMFTSFSNRAEEIFCNAVAGEVLVPSAVLDSYIDKNNILNVTFPVVDKMANKFNVSREVIVRRLLDACHIDKNIYDSLLSEIRQSQHLKKIADKHEREDKDDCYKPNPSHQAIDYNSGSICYALYLGYADGYFSRQDLSGILNIKEKHIPKFIENCDKMVRYAPI